MTLRHHRVFLASLVVLGLPIAQEQALATTARAAARESAALRTATLADAIRQEAGGKLASFYAARSYRPVWIVKGQPGPAARDLLDYLDHASLDGLKASRYGTDKLHEALTRARSGNAQDLAVVEMQLSDAFVRYVQDMRKVRNVGVEFEGKGLKPPKLAPAVILRVAAMRDFDDYIADMGWMSPHYLRMRKLLAEAEGRGASKDVLERLRLNRERARVLPSPAVRHIVVDAASGRLWYYQDGKQVGTMRVVVGAQKTQTPMLAGYVNYAIVNPYWNVPDYLTRDNVARKILSGRTLDSMNMQVLSDWSANPRVVDPSTVNWQAVADGRQEVRIRELPGPANSMGKVKFLFPNEHGIYLHDTPNRDLLEKDDRHFSNGCIRLEKAGELGRWMMGKPVVGKGKVPEQAIPLPVPVPVYLTYLTATATAKGGIAMLDDVYGRDK